jgi:hypothetical protein
MRNSRLRALAGLAAVTATLAFPAAGSALDARFIALTATGPSQTTLTMPAGQYPVWQNRDTVSHSVVFANGLCALQIAPGAFAQCDNGFSGYVGRYAYTVDGTMQASVDIVAAGRSVTLAARSHGIARHSSLTLHGTLADWNLSPPGPGIPQPVVVLARHDRRHAFHRVATVMAKVRGGQLVWHLRVRPRARAIYVAEANFQPQGGQVWQQARSRPFKVRLGG